MKKACVLPQERGILEQGDYVLACRANRFELSFINFQSY